MHHEPDFPDDDDMLGRLGALPRTASVDSAQADRIVEQLRREGFFRAQGRIPRLMVQAAAAALLFALGAFAGSRYAQRNSLEQLLSRNQLSVAERVLLLQRAGSAYVRAAQSYADATAHVDSSAVEVASRVLLGAAHAVARNGLDAGLSARLSTALTPVANSQPIIWF